MTTVSADLPAAFITFYSFKGGVGRSMALINVAGILAGRGFRVLAIDLDLEAPGISFLMRHEASRGEKPSPGFVDLLEDACARGPDGDLFLLTPEEVVERYSYAYVVPEEIRNSEEGQLRIMPAGTLDGDYQYRLDALALGQLYREGRGQPLVAAFKDVLREAKMFDFVLIDSRTGFSDEAGICTRDLADGLMIIMGLNRQNIEGTAQFLSSLKAAQVETPFRVVLSPVPSGEDELIEEREEEATGALSKAAGELVPLDLQIPYHPRLALTEEPHIFRRNKGYLYDAYTRIEGAVLVLAGQTPSALRTQIEANAESKNYPLLVRLLSRLLRLDGGGIVLGMLERELVDLCLDDGASELRRWVAEIIVPTSRAARLLASELHHRGQHDAELFYRRAIQAVADDTALLIGYAAFLTGVKNDHEAAEEYFRLALTAAPNDSSALVAYATFLVDVRKRYAEAEDIYGARGGASSKDPTVLTRYAKLLWLLGRRLEARPCVDAAIQRLYEWEVGNAMDGIVDRELPSIICEVNFYGYAHIQDRRRDYLATLKEHLKRGSRANFARLEENVRVAIADGHTEPEFLAALATVVADAAPIGTLASFKEWENVGYTRGGQSPPEST